MLQRLLQTHRLGCLEAGVGVRDELRQKGVDFDINYRSDSAYNARGGYNKDKKLAYADQYMFSVSADLDKLL
ncbi:porin [Pseudomonas putida S11]|nr:porin [Pseudomonas putida S11]